MNNKNVVLFVLVLFLFSCSGNGEGILTELSSEDRQPASSPVESVEPTKEQPIDPSCDDLDYPFERCFPLVAFNDITESKKDYIYQDPRNKSGNNPNDLIQYRKPTHFFDISKLDPNRSVSNNFILKDFLETRKGRFGIFQTHAISHVQELRNSVNRPLKVNSGYRSPGYNNKTPNASVWSRHMYGDAVDISAPTSTQIKELKNQCERTTKWIFLYETHIHCDWRDDELDRRFFDSNTLNSDLYQESKNPEDLIKAQLYLNTFERISESGEKEKILFFKIDSYVEDEEQEGPLFVEWAVFNQNTKELFQGFGSNVELKVPAGVYQVDIIVGGYKRLKSSIIVE